MPTVTATDKHALVSSSSKLGVFLGCDSEHQYCLECLEIYVRSQVQSRRWPVRCPGLQCGEEVSSEVIEAVMGHDTLQWHLLGAEHAIKNKESHKDLLKVPETATAEEIREAYKREALRTHPDRTTNLGGPNGERPLSKEEATVLFQQVADAYYVLSNTERRREYDQARRSQSRTSRQSWFSNEAPHTEPEQVFGGVFEELLRPEVQNPRTFFSPIGMASGAALGFICGGVPGAVVGAYGGKQLGKIRDNKGVSVAEAFGRLPHANKAAIIAALAAK
ncbi:hypothetical protein BGZ94_000320, partial [Podila epigama]